MLAKRHEVSDRWDISERRVTYQSVLLPVGDERWIAGVGTRNIMGILERITCFSSSIFLHNPDSKALFTRVNVDHPESGEFRSHLVRVANGLDNLINLLDNQQVLAEQLKHLAGQHEARKGVTKAHFTVRHSSATVSFFNSTICLWHELVLYFETPRDRGGVTSVTLPNPSVLNSYTGRKSRVAVPDRLMLCLSIVAIFYIIPNNTQWFRCTGSLLLTSWFHSQLHLLF